VKRPKDPGTVGAGARVRTPSGFTGTVIDAAAEVALVSRDDLAGWGPVPYDFYELEVIT
jgi:hypothetical protein